MLSKFKFNYKVGIPIYQFGNENVIMRSSS